MYVLLVEDDPMVRTIMAALLGLLEHRVLSVQSAEEALERIHEVDLLLTDLSMSPISGEELARRVRLLRPAMPIVAMSGDVDSASSVFNAFLAKPCTATTISVAISEALADMSVA